MLLNLLDAPVVTIPDQAALITVPSCPGGSDGAITISPTAITGGSQTAQAQKVNLELSGTYTQSGIYTPTGRYEVTINSTTYSYTATASNTTLESLTASITAAIDSGPLVAVSSSGKIITLTASNTAEPFTVSTNITNLGTSTRFRVEYLDPALSANTYKWEKLLGAIGTNVDNTVTLSSTLSLTGLNAGRYRLTVTNTTTCASTEAPIFSIEDKTIVSGTITANTGNVLCTDHSGFTLTVTGDSSNIGESYLWQQSSDGISGWTNVLSGTSSITTANATIGLLTDTIFYRRGVRIENGGVPCTETYSYTSAYEMIINKSTPGAVATEELLVCAGSVPSIPISESATATNNARGVITYFWESKADNGSSTWTTVTGASASSLNFTTPINLTTAFRRVVVNTINGVACNSIASNVVTITTVTPTIIDNAIISTSRILNVSCNGLSDGSINVALTDFTTDHPNPSFEWTKVGDPTFSLTTMSASALGAGTYNLTISTYTNTIAGASVPVCQAVSDNFVITEPAALSLTVSATCEGNIVATGAGGLENYIYTLTATNQAPISVAVIDGSSHTFLNLIKGATYTVTLAENGTRVCGPISEAVTMPKDLVIDNSKITVEDATCFGVNDGKISIIEPFVSGSSGALKYQWSGPAGASYFTRDISNLSPGKYTLTVTDALGCFVIYETTVGSKSALSISNEIVTNEVLSCNGATDASIDIEVTADPNSTYQIKWTNAINGTEIPGSLNSTSISALGAGSYNVTVSTSGSCEISKTFIISEPAILESSLISSESPKCFSENGGSVTIKVSGGTAPYKYSIDGGGIVSFGTASDTSLTHTISNIGSGAHVIVVTDSNSCSANTPVNFSISIPEALEVSNDGSSQITPVGCNTFGSIGVSVIGGTAPYFYSFTGPLGSGYSSTSTTLATVSDISIAGNYTIVVTDKNQCSQTINVTVPDTSAPFTVTGVVNSPQCVSDESKDSSIALTLSDNIVTPYIISWDKWDLKTITSTIYEWVPIPGSSNKKSLINLGYGEYRSTVQDASLTGCNSVVNRFTIAKSTLSIFDQSVVKPSCENTDGKYTFKINTNNSVKYYLDGALITPSSNVSSTFTFSNFSNKFTISNLIEGSYTLKVVEQISGVGSISEGCTIFSNFEIIDYTPITYNGLTDITLDLCDNTVTYPNVSDITGGDPFIDLNGDPYYIYTWIGPNNYQYVGPTPINVEEGAYELTIKDSKGCITDPISFNFSNTIDPITVTDTIVQPGCGLNSSLGEIEIDIFGGKEPYTIKWYKAKSGTEEDPTPVYEELLEKSNILKLTNLSEGNYRLVITSTIVSCDNSAINTFTKDYKLASPVITITEDNILQPTCENPEGSYSFELTVSKDVKFYLDETEIILSSDGSTAFSYNNITKRYTIGELTNGIYDLKIESQPSGTETETLSCEVYKRFEVIYTPITYNGLTDITLDLCDNTVTYPNVSDITGGDPFIDLNGDPYYIYTWFGPNNYQYVGPTPINVEEGAYELTIKDSKGCITDPISFNFSNTIDPITVTDTIVQPGCGLNSSLGEIEIDIFGGKEPYTIKWYKAKSGTEEDPTPVYEELLEKSNILKLTNLSEGNYRLVITSTIVSCDNSAINTFTKDYKLASPVITITEDNILQPTCENPEGSYSFELTVSKDVKFYLDETEIILSSDGSTAFSYNNITKRYTIGELTNGIYDLKIESQPSGTETETLSCEVYKRFEVIYTPITYNGLTDITLDLCDNTVTYPNVSDITGGDPFIDLNGDPYYIYTWFGPNNYQYVGPTPINVEEGAYELTIKDSKGCITDPISFNFSNTIDPITVTDTIIPLECGLDNSDGAINISIAGGISPYTIKWDKEIPPIDNSATPTYENIGNNLLAINNLSSGRYRLTITSSFIACNNEEIRSLTKFYEMRSPETIKLIEGPFLNKSLCLGEPGTIQVKLFDSNSDEFSFYYDSQIVTGIPIGNDFYEVIIDSPIEEGELIVINENGCGINIPIITGVGDPDFSFTSSSFQQSGIILANEDVVFNNTSQDQYHKMIWDFGDGSDILEINSENEATTEIIHKYITPGSFTVSLRFYNTLGCFKEITKQIGIGKGFLVVFPSAFTPNGDTINDIFLAKFTGLKSFNFQIFDILGNIIYTSKVETLPTDNSWGWNGNYANGKEYNSKTFRYRFNGITLDEKEVNYIGEAVILR